MPQVENVPEFDSFIHAKVILPKNVEVKRAKTSLDQSTDVEGDSKWKYDLNPMLNTRVYGIVSGWQSATIFFKYDCTK